MAQRRHPKSSPRGGQFAPIRHQSASPAPAASARRAAARDALAEREDVETGHPEDGEQHGLEIPDEERQALLAETENYLAELRAEVGEPSLKHKRRARALVDGIKQVQASR